MFIAIHYVFSQFMFSSMLNCDQATQGRHPRLGGDSLVCCGDPIPSWTTWLSNSMDGDSDDENNEGGMQPLIRCGGRGSMMEHTKPDECLAS